MSPNTGGTSAVPTDHNNNGVICWSLIVRPRQFYPKIDQNRKHNPLIIIHLAPMASGDKRGIWPDLGLDLRPGEAKRCLAKIGRHKKTGLVLAQAAWGWVTGSAVLIRCIKALTVPVLGPTRSPLIYIAHEDNTSVSTTQRFLKKELN